jgi:ABC-type transport system involved in multi-copper enzyme maturation permease subunit
MDIDGSPSSDQIHPHPGPGPSPDPRPSPPIYNAGMFWFVFLVIFLVVTFILCSCRVPFWLALFLGFVTALILCLIWESWFSCNKTNSDEDENVIRASLVLTAAAFFWFVVLILIVVIVYSIGYAMGGNGLSSKGKNVSVYDCSDGSCNKLFPGMEMNRKVIALY